MSYTKTTWVNDSAPAINASNLNKMEAGIEAAQYPDGGTSGQLLSSDGNGGGTWVNSDKALVGLGNVDNTSDAAKPISTATQAALDGKVDKVTGKGLSTNDYTSTEKTKLAGIAEGAQVNTITGVKGGSESSYRTGNVNITKANLGLGNVDNTSDANKPISSAAQTALDGKVDKVTGKGLSANDYTNTEKTKLAGIAEGAQVNTITGVKGDSESSYRTGNVNITKANVGLGNVDNTSDANKPISTAVQTALNGKQNTLTFDNVPVANSANPVKSGGIYSAIDDVRNLIIAAHSADWDMVPRLIARGLGPVTYPVGSQFIVPHSDYTSILFDVVHHITPQTPLTGITLPNGVDYGMVLLQHGVIYGTQFDEVEAVYYAEEGLAAGTYNITIANQAWVSADNGKTFQFTLTQAVPAGGQLVWSGYDKSREGISITSYASATSTTAIESVTMTEGSGGTSLGTTDGSGDVNHFHRSVLGSNNYGQSGIRQWINASGSDWWVPSNKWDRPYAQRTRNGYLGGFGDADFKSAILQCTLQNYTNGVYDMSGINTGYTTQDKFFLLANEDVGFSKEGSSGINAGGLFDYYKNAADVDRIKYDISDGTTARHWWLRVPLPIYAYTERVVSSSGARYNHTALYAIGAVPACVIGYNQG